MEVYLFRAIKEKLGPRYTHELLRTVWENVVCAFMLFPSLHSISRDMSLYLMPPDSLSGRYLKHCPW